MHPGFNVLFEDNHLLIADKPPGLLVQGDATGDESLVDKAKHYVRIRYSKPGAVFMGLVHRLDRPVSGIVVLAKTSKALERMNKLFHDRKTTKTYYAIVDRKPPSAAGTLVHWLRKDERTNRTTAFSRETADALRSELDYAVVAQREGLWLLKVNPVTGRPHQIRVQLSSMHCPITGDVKYGSSTLSGDGSIYLHAGGLDFEHPVKKEALHIMAPFRDFGLWRTFSDLP